MDLELDESDKNGEAYILLKYDRAVKSKLRYFDKKKGYKSHPTLNDIEDELNYIHENKELYGIHEDLNIYAVKTSPSDIHPDLKDYDKGNYILLKANLRGAKNEKVIEEATHAANQLYSVLKPAGIEAGYKEHDEFHYEDKGKYHHLRKSQKVY